MSDQNANSGCGFLILICLFLGMLGNLDGCGGGGGGDDKIDKIIKAKSIVKSMVNYPDTLDFHDMSTSVSGNNVTLKFTAKNGFGVPSTYTKTITVD